MEVPIDYVQGETVVVENANDGWSKFLVVCILLWAIIGLLGFFMSLVCFFFEGTTTDKFVGLITSMILGPLYWIYYAFADKTYCSSSPGIEFPTTPVRSTPPRRRSSVSRARSSPSSKKAETLKVLRSPRRRSSA